MIQTISGVFLILHGLVYLLYAAQSYRLFELRPKMTWPDGSLVFSKLPGEQVIRGLGSIFCLLSSLGFVLGGLFLFFELSLWKPVIIVSAIFASVIFILLWDGKINKLNDKGGYGILINIAILIALVVLQWPDFGF